MYDEEMEEEYDTYAYFYVCNFDCKPQEISDILGLEPFHMYEKGDLIHQSAEHKRTFSSWEFRSSLPAAEYCQGAHVSNILDILKYKRDAILTLNSKYETGINCVGYYTNVNPGFHLSAQSIKTCADLGLGIDFDLYTVGIIEVEEIDPLNRLH